MGTDDFYEGQGRLDGALKPAYEILKWNLLLLLLSALELAYLLRQGDQVTSTPAELAQFSDNAQRVVLQYIRGQLEKAAA